MQSNKTCFGLQSKMAERCGENFSSVVSKFNNALSFVFIFLLFSVENGLASNTANICERSFYLGQRDRRKRTRESSMCSSVSCF